MTTSFYVFVALCALPPFILFLWWQVERARTRRMRRVLKLRESMLQRAMERIDRDIAHRQVKIAEAVEKGITLTAEHDALLAKLDAERASLAVTNPQPTLSAIKAKPCATCGHILLSHRSISNGRTTEFYECAVRGCSCRKGRRPPPTPTGPHSLA